MRSGTLERFFSSVISSPVGALTLVVSEAGVLRVQFGSDPPRLGTLAQLTESAEETGPCRIQLEEYFAGARQRFTVPLNLKGTSFQLCCWNALRQIPFGETRSYAQIASVIGRPEACRAVGAANGQNPIAILVPCHRVIGANGSLTGYGGGLEIKRRLLEWEAQSVLAGLQQL